MGPMRPRFLIPLLLLAALAVALALLAARHPPPPYPRPPARHHDPMPAGHPDFGEPAPGWMAEVIPMHQAVRRAGQRFEGRVLDIALLPPGPGPSPLVYRIRLLTRAGDVLDIRMDALDGRFLELRGADLSGVRRDKPNRKD